MIWDLEAIAVPGSKDPPPPIFLPYGPAYRLIDELFLLVLDGRDNATAKYFTIAANASETGASHTDSQIQLLLREAPAEVVKEWPVLRQYRPRLKKLVTEMANTLSRAENASDAQRRHGLLFQGQPGLPRDHAAYGQVNGSTDVPSICTACNALGSRPNSVSTVGAICLVETVWVSVTPVHPGFEISSGTCVSFSPKPPCSA